MTDNAKSTDTKNDTGNSNDKEKQVLKRPCPALTGSQRRQLRGMAHSLNPVVHIGHQGVTEPVLASVSRALDDHELIKVKVNGNLFEDLKDVADAVSAGTGAETVQKIGRVLIFYRPAPEKPQIKLK